jgi:dihydroorotate dehydrogenase (fumarate)
MKLDVNYLGLKLKSPLMLGASPLTDQLDYVKKFEDAGAAAIVLRSLFEEQIEMEERAFHFHVESHADSSAEASSGFLPKFTDFAFDSERYLDHIRKIKESVKVPVIGSLNGITSGGWEHYSKLIEEAGADALELNFYDLPTEPNNSCLEVEQRYIEILKNIRMMVKIPLSIKLSPFFSSLPHFVHQLTAAGADGLVLFNRLYQPEIDIENLQVKPSLYLSDSSELPLRLRWLAILEPHFKGSMAVAGGVHTIADVIKAIMAGATTTQMVSALMKNGPVHFARLESELKKWLVEHEYESIDQLRGSMSLRTCPDPSAFGRTNYMKILHGWNVLMLDQ